MMKIKGFKDNNLTAEETIELLKNTFIELSKIQSGIEFREKQFNNIKPIQIRG